MKKGNSLGKVFQELWQKFNKIIKRHAKFYRISRNKCLNKQEKTKGYSLITCNKFKKDFCKLLTWF